jgi:anti-sigma-K factor RskA
LEEYEEAYERLVEEWAERLSDYYGEDEEEALWEEARERAEEKLK